MSHRTVIRRLLPCTLAAALGCANGAARRANEVPRPAPAAPALATEIRRSLRVEEFGAWYPRAIDREQGGFLSQFDYRWQPTGAQDKMIITQARHVWTTARASCAT